MKPEPSDTASAGRISIFTVADGVERDLPLAPSTLLGRSPLCTWSIGHAALPSFWLELRWEGAERAWHFRVLVGEELTHSRVAPSDGWGRLKKGWRIKFSDVVVITLLSAGPPLPFAIELRSHEALEGEAFHDAFEVLGTDVRPIGWDLEDNAAQPSRDGDVYVIDGRAVRVHLPTSPMRTALPGLDLNGDDLYLDLDRADDGWKAIFTQGNRDLVVEGENARGLLVYALARRMTASDDGWLDHEAATQLWVALGGNPDSKPDRMHWLRSELRRRIASQGVANPETLFEQRRRGRQKVFRLCLPTDRIQLPDDVRALWEA